MKGVDEKMKTSELIKLLKQAGFKKSGEGGNHTEFLNPTTGKKIYVWRHKKEVPTGTANKILKDAVSFQKRTTFFFLLLPYREDFPISKKRKSHFI